MSKAVVPGIPLAALNYISDQNTKAVLTALIDGWQMRNDQTGSGEHRFLTKADLEDSITTMVRRGQLVGSASGSGPSSGSGPGSTPPGVTPGLIDGFIAKIVESKLWKDLSQQIDLININGARNTADVLRETTRRVNADNAIIETTTTQFATINNNVAALQITASTLANNYAALVTSTNTLQASVNGLTSSLQQEATVRANADGELYAQYTVKIDNNGYVSGFGFASTVNNSTARSEFYIRADRFGIGSPTVPRVLKYPPEYDEEGNRVYEPIPAANIPFIVRTDNWVDANGVTRNGGVFMKGAWIEYAAIDTAHIRDLSVDTIKIAGNAVTIPSSAMGNMTQVHDYNTLIASVTVNFPHDCSVMTMFSFNGLSLGGGAGDLGCVVTLDGVQIYYGAVSLASGYSYAYAASTQTVVWSGAHIFRLYAFTANGPIIEAHQPFISVIGVMK